MIEHNKSLKAYNSFGFDQKAERFAVARSEQELEELVGLAKDEGWPVFVLGGGSNVVLTRDVAGLVIYMGMSNVDIISQDELGNMVVRASAGVNWHDFVLKTLAMKAYGLENLSLIPGCVGAAPVQNIGAYGIEVKDRIKQVRALHLPTANWQSFTAADCQFSYRHSFFKDAPGEYAITQVDFDLGVQCDIVADYSSLTQQLSALNIEKPTAKNISDTVISIRQTRLPDPNKIGNAGSFFHNPIVTDTHASKLREQFPELVIFPANKGFTKLSAAWLIDKAGFKGIRKEGVGVFEKQALVLVNHGSGTGSQILSLAADIQAAVRGIYDVELSVEPTVL